MMWNTRDEVIGRRRTKVVSWLEDPLATVANGQEEGYLEFCSNIK